MTIRTCIRGRNCEHYIGKCLKSITQQTYLDWLAFVALDDPKDKSEEKVKEWRRRFQALITYKVFDKHLGLCGNLWRVLQMAMDGADDEDIIAIVDADDRLLPLAFKTVVHKYASRPDLLVTYGSYTKHSVGRTTKISQSYPPNAVVRKHPWRGSHLKTFKVKLARQLTPEMFKEQTAWMPAASDLALMFPLMEMAGLSRCEHISTPIYLWRDDTRDHTSRKLQRKYEKILRKRKPLKRIVL